MIYLKNSKNEKGFTLLEVLFSLVIISLFFILLINAYMLGVGKTNYLENEKNIIGFEQELTNWVLKDYRENSLVNIEIDKDNLIMETNLGESIKYENRGAGFYRVTDLESKMLTSKSVKVEIGGKNEDIIFFTYKLGNKDKRMSVKLEK